MVNYLEVVMPAITVENPLALPRVPAPPRESAAPRPVLAVSTAPSGFEGEGFLCAGPSPESTTGTWTRSS